MLSFYLLLQIYFLFVVLINYEYVISNDANSKFLFVWLLHFNSLTAAKEEKWLVIYNFFLQYITSI